MGDEVTLTGTIVMTVRAEPWLFEVIENYRNALQYVVDSILKDPTKYGYYKYIKKEGKLKWYPNINKLHKEFYETLKSKYRLPAKISQDCFRQGSYIAKSVLNNDKNEENKAKIKSKFMRLNNQAYKLIWVNNFLDSVKIIGLGEVKVTGFPKKLYKRYKDWKLGDMILKIDKKGKIKAYLSLSRDIKISEPSSKAVAVDLNFEEVVVGNLAREIRFRAPLQRIMHIKKNHIEKTQKRYTTTWLAINNIKKSISRLWERVNGIMNNFVKQTSKEIVKWMKQLGYDTVILEDLEQLRDKQAKLTKPWRERFTFFAYRKLQNWIEWQAKKEGLAVVYLPPHNTSSMCPYCGEKMINDGNRTVKCKCGFRINRDKLAVWNLYLKWSKVLRCGELRCSLNGET